MKNLFLDPQKPLATCTSNNCQGCVLKNDLQCHFSSRELLRFLGIAFPVFIIGGIGIARVNAWMLIPWLVISFCYFGFIEIRVMCSHCPHYAEPGTKSLQCWANYGSPKLWKYRPGPMSTKEKVMFFSGLVLIAGIPLVVILLGMVWLWLILFIVSVLTMGTLMSNFMCNRCTNFACPFNHVELKMRKAFFDRNPTIANAWKGDPS